MTSFYSQLSTLYFLPFAPREGKVESRKWKVEGGSKFEQKIDTHQPMLLYCDVGFASRRQHPFHACCHRLS